VKAEWGASENNRRARYYTLTAAGRKQLRMERDEFERVTAAIQKVLQCLKENLMRKLLRRLFYRSDQQQLEAEVAETSRNSTAR
jgi:DNA-binding PadR family transcriptional regulator